MSSGEETPDESKDDEPDHSAHRQARLDESGDDEDEADTDGGEWIDEDGTEGDAGDLLQLEFHPDYVRDPKKRRRRWDLLWDSLLRDVSAVALSPLFIQVGLTRLSGLMTHHSSMHSIVRRTPLSYCWLHLFTHQASSIPSHREQSAAIAPARRPT